MQNQERWKHLELLPLRQVEMIPEFRIVIGRGPGAAFPQIVSFQLRDQIGHLPAIDGIGGGMARGLASKRGRGNIGSSQIDGLQE